MDSKQPQQWAMGGGHHRAQRARPSWSKRRVFTAVVLLSVALTATNLTSLFSSHSSSISQSKNFAGESKDPADSFEDNTWPIRQQTAWDISTDFPYPRLLQYSVTEGTWLRLDVHPKTGDVVFDMIGELYCIPGRFVLDSNFVGEQTDARPILQGIPYDSDPHFSPAGDKLVFSSDAGLGLGNIWVTEWKGCEQMDLRSQANSALVGARTFKEEDEELLLKGVAETKERRVRRLLREGRLDAKRVSNETYRWVSDARFHPTQSKVVATKWYTSERSIGAGEGWEYDIPSLDGDSQEPIGVASGKRVVSRVLPSGFTDYEGQQVGPEQVIWNGEDGLIYAKNVIDSRTFTYSKDVHSGIYSIFSKNLTTGVTETLVDSTPGGASRPELSRDRKTLAFVRRVRDKSVLVLKDLETGTLHHVWDGLSYDLSVIYAPMGTYPSFSFTPNDDAIIIWAAGQINRVPLKKNDFGERVLASDPQPIPFEALIELRLGELRHLDTSVDLLNLESADTSRLYAFKDLQVDEEGKKAVFQAAGTSVVQVIGSANLTSVPVLKDDEPYYSPSFAPGTNGTVVVHSRWSDTAFTSLEIANLNSGKAFEVAGLPLGRYRRAILSPATSGNTRTLAFLKTPGDYLTGEVIATANPGLWLADIDFSVVESSSGGEVDAKNLRFIPTDIDTTLEVISVRFVEASKILVEADTQVFIVDLAGETDPTGKPPHYPLAAGKHSIELRVSLKPKQALQFRDWFTCMEEGDWFCMNAEDEEGDSGYAVENVAFEDFLVPFVAPGSTAGESEEGVWSKPGNATKGLARVGVDGGHSLTWSADGKKLFWFLGPYLHSLEVSKISECSAEIEADTETFGIGCIKKFIEFQEVVFEHSTDISRLKKEAQSKKLIIENARLLTLHTGDLDDDLIEGGTLVVKDGVIESVGEGQLKKADFEDAEVIDAEGGFVIPGFLDVHAHWGGQDNVHPAKSWEMETFLAYGVTTMHNPSTDTVNTFIERARVESGQFVGPRILHTGTILYGAGGIGYHQLAVDRADARSSLLRIKTEGGPYGISYKNYNQPSRASRQRLLSEAKNLSMLCVPEGGMSFDWDLTYFIDGMTTLEHTLPPPVLHDDIIQLVAQSGTADTPTHVVSYGGASGDQWTWGHEAVPDEPKLRQFTRHDILETLSETTSRPKTSWQIFNVSASLSKVVANGGKTLIGAHGEPPLGVNYHQEIWFTQQGGLSNYQSLQAASSWAAQTFGLFGSVGSLAEGKLADFLIYHPDAELLEGSIQQTRNIKYVVRGGRVWNADTMEEVWPVKGRKQVMPQFNAD